jgi:hypothetical protein
VGPPFSITPYYVRAEKSYSLTELVRILLRLLLSQMQEEFEPTEETRGLGEYQECPASAVTGLTLQRISDLLLTHPAHTTP